MNTSRKGFTIVELLIVIVVIAILAAISIVAYSGIQQRSRDSQRSSDIQAIVKGLELYKTQNGDYPAAVSTAGQGGWEVSTAGSSEFLSALRTGGFMSKVPVDPINRGAVSPPTSDSYFYFYYRYPAGYLGCDVAKGSYFVLRVLRGEASNVSPNMPTQVGCGAAPSGSGWYMISRFSQG